MFDGALLFSTREWTNVLRSNRFFGSLISSFDPQNSMGFTLSFYYSYSLPNFIFILISFYTRNSILLLLFLTYCNLINRVIYKFFVWILWFVCVCMDGWINLSWSDHELKWPCDGFWVYFIFDNLTISIIDLTLSQLTCLPD